MLPPVTVKVNEFAITTPDNCDNPCQQAELRFTVVELPPILALMLNGPLLVTWATVNVPPLDMVISPEMASHEFAVTDIVPVDVEIGLNSQTPKPLSVTVGFVPVIPLIDRSPLDVTTS